MTVLIKYISIMYFINTFKTGKLDLVINKKVLINKALQSTT